MCGIAGVMSADGRAPDPATLDRLAAALAHRGPDGRGRMVEGGVGLVHTRLAIIDLETGAQPLRTAGGAVGARTSLIANGEIYNHVELRADLADAPFATRSDCEPALHLYARHGMRFTDGLRGMYAMTLHDAARGPPGPGPGTPSASSPCITWSRRPGSPSPPSPRRFSPPGW